MLNLNYHIINMQYGILIFLLSSLLFSIIIMKKNKKKKLEYPPSPPKLPLLGHLHLISSLPHQSFHKLSKKYGPVMLLKLGSVPTIVISTPAAAKQALKDHDLACCSRPMLAASRRFSYNFVDLNLSPYGERWRELRKICMLELFGANRVQSFQHVREQEADLMLKSMISQISTSSTNGVINLSEESFRVMANIITRIAFGKGFRSGIFEKGNFHEVIHRAMVALGSISMSDLFPKVGWIIDWLSGAHGRLEKSFGELDAFFEQVVDHRIKFGSNNYELENNNIVDVLLKIEKDRSQSAVLDFAATDRIKALIMDIFLAGVDAPSQTIVWAMAELIKNSKVMKKLQTEIRNSIKNERVKENDLEKLQYLKLVIKEVLRLHPPVPLLLPRETTSRFELNGYNVDRNARLHVNVWAIGRDPDLWTNPEEFIPERFIESSVDFRGQHFELLPFGAGRRSCPGMNMGMAMVELILANLLVCFDWELPNGMKEEDFEMEEDVGLSAGRKSILNLVPLIWCP